MSSIQLVRNATLVVKYAAHKILIDPMFAQVGALGSIAGEINSPTVDLS